MRDRKPYTNVTLAGLLLFVIGAGNLIMGYTKVASVQEAREAAQKSSMANSSKDPLAFERIDSKRRYYDLVSLGGITFIVAGGALLAFDLIRRRP